MPLVLADEREAEDVRGENRLLVNPAREVAPEAARVRGVVSALVFVAELCEAGLTPLAVGPPQASRVKEGAFRFARWEADSPAGGGAENFGGGTGWLSTPGRGFGPKPARFRGFVSVLFFAAGFAGADSTQSPMGLRTASWFM